jgi:hypothetical protein
MMRNIAYYVTGHGFGHATRTGAIIAALLEGNGARDPIFVHIVSDVPPWIFKELEPHRSFLAIRSKRNDVGLIQKDGLSIDFAASSAALAVHLETFDRGADDEADFLTKARIDLVLSDVPALPFLAAARAGVPSIGVSNFGWDFIYRAYAARDPIFRAAVARFERAYGEASLLYRLPFATPMDAFSHAEDVPLVVRRSRRSRADVRRDLGFDEDPRPMVLICFGGLGLSALDEGALFAERSMIILAFGPDPSRSRDHVRFVGNDEFYFPDLVNVADVIVSKPGYGLVAESIAHQTAFLYVPREDFAESPYLVRAMEAHVASAPTSLEALESGRFLNEARALIRAKSRDTPPVAIDGARAIADRVRRRLGA